MLGSIFISGKNSHDVFAELQTKGLIFSKNNELFLSARWLIPCGPLRKEE